MRARAQRQMVDKRVYNVNGHLELGQAAPSFPPFIFAPVVTHARVPIDYFSYAI